MDAPQAALCVRRESPVMLEVANVRCAPREWNVWSRRLPAVGIRRVSFARAALATRGRRCRLLVATTAIATRRSCDCIGLHACRRLYRSPLSLTACRNRQTTRLGHVLVVRLHLRCSNLLVLAHVSSATCSSLAWRPLRFNRTVSGGVLRRRRHARLTGFCWPPLQRTRHHAEDPRAYAH